MTKMLIGILGFSVSLKAENWEEWLIQHRVVLLSRRTSTSWKNGLTGSSLISARRIPKSCTWG